MKAMFLIADYGCMQTVKEIFGKENIPCRFMLHGHGSADSAMLDYLGLGDNKKIIAVTFVANDAVLNLYKLFNNRLSLSQVGTGIAFTVPVSGASGLAFALNGTNAETEGNAEMTEPKHELIITIVNRGGFEAVKEASKAAGARGGTLLHGLGLGGEEAAKFLGISIQPEKDIVLIVVDSEDREHIMQTILDKAGIRTDYRGICFSMPVDSALGLAGKNDDIAKIIKQ